MILSRKMISDYIDLDDDLSIRDIAEDMTKVGNEYDSCGPLIDATNLTIGKIVECTDHPDSDHLHLCKVDIGNEILNIVCGAPNAREGIKVIVALDGAELPGGTIKKSIILGAESNGMLCSLKELGLDNKFLTDEEINGISELPEDAPIGENPIKYLELDDEVIDFDLTANRGDELSALGLAYELGAIYSKKVKNIEISHKESNRSIKNEFNIEVQTDNCKLLLVKKVCNLAIKESPKFIKNRLIASGIRPINNVVDISNYVMLETGQPLHFYDADRLGNTLVVRMAQEGEKLITLDNILRELSTSDIVIANAKDPVGLAGVMGGLTTEVENNTKNIVIEAAIFNSVLVRKTSKKILRSEASNRFEKGLDPNRTYMAIERVCHLLELYASGEIEKDILEYKNINMSEKEIAITKDNINNVLGTNIDNDTIIGIFDRLGFKSKIENENILVTVPTRRLDINIKEDLIEEVGRIYGINNITGKLPKLNIKKGTYDKRTRSLRNKLVDLGLNEVLTQIFLNEEIANKFKDDDYEIVNLLDPLSAEKNSLRYSLVPSLMKVYDYNKARNLKDISIFEMAKGFYKKENNYGEKYKLAIMMTGNYYKELGNNKTVDFYVIKGIVEEVLDYLGYKNRYTLEVKNIPNYLNPYQAASINLNGKYVGYLGKLHPNFYKESIFVSELDLDLLDSLKVSNLKYKEINKYPSIKEDLSFIVDKDILASDMMKAIKKAAGKYLTNIEVFDLYTGSNLEKGKKSLGFSLTFEDSKKTLTEEEISKIIENIVKELGSKMKATLRNS